MAQFIMEPPFGALNGKISKKTRIIFRQKGFAVGNATPLYHGPLEAYTVERPRDRKKNPPSPAEQAAIDRFRRAMNDTTAQLADPDKHAYWEQRFQHQLKHPEPAYKGNYRSGKERVFTNLYTYVRTMLLRQYTSEAKQSQQTNN